MKVINVGKKDKWWTGLKGTCGSCGTIVQLEETDKPSVHDDQRDGTSAVVRCPTCFWQIWFNK